MRIVVHGGAGGMPPKRAEAARLACESAARAGFAVLANGGSALDAVERAVRVLEDAEACNAGRGAALTLDGRVEVDASIMDGSNLAFGGVAALPNCGQAVAVSRAILEDGRHALLAGERAWEFALERGFEPAPADTLLVERTREMFARGPQAASEEPAPSIDRRPGAVDQEPGTVGACALDRAGNLAAATSTGGTFFKRPGRVGDTPLCGCGTYADNRLGAASATGLGEGILKITMTRFCCDRLAADATQAVWSAVDELATRVRCEGGIIGISPSGEVGVAHSSLNMPFAIAADQGPTEAMICRAGIVMERHRRALDWLRGG